MDRMGALLFAQWRGAVSVLVSAFLLAPTILWPNPAAADGALAVGLPSDVAQSGVAFGYAVNYSTRDAAAAAALESCRNSKNSTDTARSLCSVIDTFRGQCLAIAMDPQDGTPGVGWAIGTTKQKAEIQALAECIETAGESRRGACQVMVTRCDGT